MFITYHPLVNKIDQYPRESTPADWYTDDTGWTQEFTTSSFSVWMVPGTIDPKED